jgi:hypothetical protein
MALIQKCIPWLETWNKYKLKTCSLLKKLQTKTTNPIETLESRDMHYVLVPKAEQCASRI